jgi:hypothetical protein
MQVHVVDLKSECFTPESRPNKDFTRDSLQWKDCKVVTVISPLHQGSKLSSCNRTFQGRTGWKKQCVKQPDCVKYYNEGMFGIYTRIKT